MNYQITLSEHRNDGTVVPLLFGETSVDMPTLLCAYNLELLLYGGYVDCTRFRWEDDAGDELVRIFAELAWAPFEELESDFDLRFRIEQEGNFLLETRPYRDPRPVLSEVISGGETIGLSGVELLYLLISGAPIVEASGYAASCGWGTQTIVLPEVAWAS